MKAKKPVALEPHFYDGTTGYSIKCRTCDKEPGDYIHFRNGGTICDNPDGPCSCGSWHKPIDLKDIEKRHNSAFSNFYL